MTDSQSPQPDPNGSDGPLPQESSTSRKDEITLMGLLVTLTRGRGLIVLFVVGFGLLGLLYAVGTPSQYTASAKVVPEAGEDGGGELPSGLPSISGLGGLSLGGGAAGLTQASYPEIATSREVRLAAARDTFYFPSTGRRTTFVDHVNRPAGMFDYLLEYTLFLPWTLKSAVGELIRGEDARPAGMDRTGTVIYPNDEEEEAIAALREKVSASVSESGALEEGSGLMTISTTAGDATLAARLNEHVIEHLRTRVREIRTETTRENLNFIQQRFDEVSQELDAAEDRLAKFLERNRSVLAGGNEPQLEFRRERLRREVRFKEQLYSQLQEQVTQTRLQLQREQPVVTVAEKPAPPPEPSAPNRPLTVILAVLIGGLFGTAGSFFQAAVRGQEGERRREQLREVTESWMPSGILEGVRRLFGEGKTR